jgi:hypothetical protein
VPGAQAAFGAPAIKRRYPQQQRYGVRTARASGTSTRRTTTPRPSLRAMLLVLVSHVCPAVLRCCAASVLAWPTTSGQRNNVSRGHGQAQCHDQNSGVIINVSQVAFPATTGNRISGQPANAPAQPSSSTSPSPGNSGKCIVIADHHQPSFRHGQEPWIASPPPPAFVGQRSGMVSNQHQLAWHGHQNLASAPPKQKPLASAPACLSFWPTHRHSRLPLAGASLRPPSSRQVPYDDWQHLASAPAMVGNDWHGCIA